MEHKSKEEILDKYAIGCTAGQYDIETGKAEAALSEYAQQVAISFAEWMKKAVWSHSAYLIEEPVWKLTGNYLMQNPTVENKDYTSAELYTLFLTHKSI